MSRRNRTLIVVALAIVTASLASWGVYRAVLQRPTLAGTAEQRPLVLATRLIPAGSVIGPDDVRLALWPADAVVPGSFERVEDVVGRGVRSSVQQNEPISRNRLAEPGAGAGLALLIPEGMVAHAVRVNDVVGVAGFLVPGSRVNVITTVDDFTGTLLRDIEVVASGTVTDPSPVPGAQPTGQASTVTLLVTEDQSEKLALAQNKGSITLALRSATGKELSETSGVRLENLFRGAQPPPPPVTPAPRRPRATPTPPPPPPPPPPAPPKMDVIVGSTVTTVEVPKAGPTTSGGGRAGGGGGGR